MYDKSLRDFLHITGSNELSSQEPVIKESEQKAAAKKFAEVWKNRGYEKGETHRTHESRLPAAEKLREYRGGERAAAGLE